MQPQRKPTASKKLLRSLQNVQRRGRARRPRQQRLHGVSMKKMNVCIIPNLYNACNTRNANPTYRAFGCHARPSPGLLYSHCWSRPQCMCSLFPGYFFNTIPVYCMGHSHFIKGHNHTRKSCPPERYSSSSSSYCHVIGECFLVTHSGDPIYIFGFKELITVLGISFKEANTGEGSLFARPAGSDENW